jgi:hypothetical protein
VAWPKIVRISSLFWKYHTHKMSLSDKLPLSVQASVESWHKGASSLAVIVSAFLQGPSTSYRKTDKLVDCFQTALFAAVQISLIQTVIQYQNLGDTVPWRFLRWFMYAGVFVDLGGTASAIAIVNMASSASVTARSWAIRKKNSLPSKILLEGEAIDPDLLEEANEMQLLRKFGMSRRWAIAGWHMWISFTLGSIFIFTSLAIWIWLTETTGVAAALMPIILPSLYPIIHVAW